MQHLNVYITPENCESFYFEFSIFIVDFRGYSCLCNF